MITSENALFSTDVQRASLCTLYELGYLMYRLMQLYNHKRHVRVYCDTRQTNIIIMIILYRSAPPSHMA
jgi:hypothetical protein